MLQDKLEKIERRVDEMRMYEEYLEKVRDANPDEYPELNDILARHKQLTDKKRELEQASQDHTDKYEEINAALIKFEKNCETE